MNCKHVKFLKTCESHDSNTGFNEKIVISVSRNRCTRKRSLLLQGHITRQTGRQYSFLKRLFYLGKSFVN